MGTKVCTHGQAMYKWNPRYKTHLSLSRSDESNKSRRPTKTGIGFGASATAKAEKTKTKKNSTETSNSSAFLIDDFAVFPALQEAIQSTLVPGYDSIGINDEIYDRLDQIYGFPNFNRQGVNVKTPNEKTPVSLGDILSIGSTTVQQSVSNLPTFDSIRVLHVDPLVLAVDHFFSDEECDRYISMSLEETTVQTRSPTVGKDSTAKAQRTSTTFYHMYERVPELLSKATRLLGIDELDRLEEPQTVRYQRNQRFTWHLDALGPGDLALSGQRVATLLVYLTELAETDGGATLFRDLQLRVRPTKGTALLFFPAAGGIPGAPLDIRTLHCGEAVRGDSCSDKWIAQLWLREKAYRPTVPPGNLHSRALRVVEEYCVTV